MTRSRRAYRVGHYGSLRPQSYDRRLAPPVLTAASTFMSFLAASSRLDDSPIQPSTLLVATL